MKLKKVTSAEQGPTLTKPALLESALFYLAVLQSCYRDLTKGLQFKFRFTLKSGLETKKTKWTRDVSSPFSRVCPLTRAESKLAGSLRLLLPLVPLWTHGMAWQHRSANIRSEVGPVSPETLVSRPQG